MVSSLDYRQGYYDEQSCNLNKVIAMIDHGEPISLIAPQMNVLASDLAYLRTLYAQSHNWRDLLSIQTARAWPVKYAKAYATFVAQSPYMPDYKTPPCSLRERFMAEVLEDSLVAKEIRVQFWKALVFDGLQLPCYYSDEKWSVPKALYDHHAVHRWIGIKKIEGWKDMLYSLPYFLFSEPALSREDRQALLNTICEDSVSGFMMPLDISGTRLTKEMISLVLFGKAIKITTYLYKNKPEFRRFIKPRSLLFYACANWSNKDCVPFLAMLEEDNPGLISGSVDIFGHDALWYTLYNQDNYLMATPEARSGKDPVDIFLIEHGCDPNRKSVIGLSFNDLTS